MTDAQAPVVPDTPRASPRGADSVKAQAAITWVGVADGQPDAGGKNFLAALPDLADIEHLKRLQQP